MYSSAGHPVPPDHDRRIMNRHPHTYTSLFVGTGDIVNVTVDGIEGYPDRCALTVRIGRSMVTIYGNHDEVRSIVAAIAAA